MKNMVGVISGTLQVEKELFEGAKDSQVDTPYGVARLKESDGIIFVQRHGKSDIPPHMINHKANIWALSRRTDTIIALSSVGSVKPSIKPPAIVIPHDYVSLNPPTFFDDRIVHATPGFDEPLRQTIIRAARKNKIRTLNRGVYWQSPGPRLETESEVRMISRFADLVGMTVASEATLAGELGLSYAAICSVDNFANGVGRQKLKFEDIRASAAKNRANIESLLTKVLGERK